MPFLIDGHNLIGQMPGISLSDEDDEGALVMQLRRYTTAKRGRQVVVVFDHGVYGHRNRLDGYGVTCYFARSPQDADAQLMKRIINLKRPHEWRLVTSDRQVARVAENHGVRVISSHDFARRLTALTQPTVAPSEELREFRLSESEIQEWLDIFRERAEQKEAEQFQAEQKRVEKKQTSRKLAKRAAQKRPGKK